MLAPYGYLMSHTPLTPSAPVSQARILGWTVACLLCLLAWDAAGKDLALAHTFGTATGFPLRDHWFFVQIMHEGPRRLAWLLAAALIVFIWRPLGPLRNIGRAERAQLALTTLLSLLVVSMLKYASTTSCPWDLAEFGGRRGMCPTGPWVRLMAAAASAFRRAMPPPVLPSWAATLPCATTSPVSRASGCSAP